MSKIMKAGLRSSGMGNLWLMMQSRIAMKEISTEAAICPFVPSVAPL